MLKNILCGIAILLGLALFVVDSRIDSQLANLVGMALIAIGLFSIGGKSSEDDCDDGQISPADRVRKLRKEQNSA